MPNHMLRALSRRLTLSLAALGCAPPALADFSVEVFAMPGAEQTYVLGMNERGDVAGSFSLPGSGVAYGFTRVGGVYNVVNILGTSEGGVQDIDDDGRIVGSCLLALCPGSGYVRSPTGGVQLRPRPDIEVWQPLGVNEQLQITGWARIQGVAHGFVWSGAGWTLLDMPGAQTTAVRDVNASGVAVGTFVTGATAPVSWGAFMHDAGGYTELRYPGASETQAWDINDDGLIVGVATVAQEWTGFLRQADGRFEALAFPGASFIAPEDINSSGQIAGYFWNGSRSMGFIATPTAAVPEPQAWLLMLAGIGAWIGRRRLQGRT